MKVQDGQREIHDKKGGTKHEDTSANIMTEAEGITEGDRQINMAFFIKPEHP